MEAYFFDPRFKTEFEIFESLRIYIERVQFIIYFNIVSQNGRPNNYL